MSLAIVALLARLMVALLCHPQWIASGASVADDVLGPISICTSHGLVPLSDGPAPGGGEPVDRLPADYCPACALVNAAVLVVLLVVTLLALPRPTAIVWFWPSRSPLPDHVLCGAVRTRAPPLPA